MSFSGGMRARSASTLFLTAIVSFVRRKISPAVMTEEPVEEIGKRMRDRLSVQHRSLAFIRFISGIPRSDLPFGKL